MLTMTSRSDDAARSIQFSDRVECPRHGRTMVLVTHKLSDKGRKYVNGALPATVEFYRCTAMTTINYAKGYTVRRQCTFMRPNKYQRRQPGERHK